MGTQKTRTRLCAPYFGDDEADILVSSNANSTSSRRLVAAIVNSGSQDNVLISVDFVQNPRPIEKSVGIIKIGGQRIPASHVGDFAFMNMSALVVPQARDNILSMSKITIVGTLLVPANSTLNSVIHAQVPA